MDNQRLLLWAALGFLLLQVWTSWQLDYGPRPQPPVAETGVSETTNLTGLTEQTDSIPSDDLPPAVTTTGAQSGVVSSDIPGAVENEVPEGERITVTTDNLRVYISTVGGDINGVELLQYPTSLETPDDPFVLMSSDIEQYFVTQSGLRSSEIDLPNHGDQYTVAQTEYYLADGQNEVRVPLQWTSENGVMVTKTFVFTRDRYLIDVQYDIQNDSGSSINVEQYRQLSRKPVTDDETQSFIYTFIGGVVSTPEDAYTKVDFGDFADTTNTRESLGGWAAIIEHYFVGAWVPDQNETNTIYTKSSFDQRRLPQQRYNIGLLSRPQQISSGSAGTLSTGLFVGPKIQERMRDVAPNLDLTVDYGFLSVIAKPIFWLLQKIHSIVGNWGWAIVGVTMCIKLLFYKLSEASYRSMARMRKLQPQLASLKERYGDDRAKMGQATMDLYKKEKVNPLGGCLPILVQIPVFISLYWVLLESVELRQAPWILWIEDLSLMDKFYVLPVIMGITMFIQQKLNPAPVDPIQAKVFLFMPLVFTIFFAFFPAGLVLYWVVNNTLSIAQQYYITRHVLAEK